MRGAVFSDCRRYRYKLTRELGVGPTVTLVMVNPSTADDFKDDPTIRRVLSFGRQFGWGKVTVVNKFAWISPHIRELEFAVDPVGPMNDYYIEKSVRESQFTVVAWGNLAKLRNASLKARASAISGLLNANASNVFCWGLTSDRQPRHPLFLRKDTSLVPWRPSE